MRRPHGHILLRSLLCLALSMGAFHAAQAQVGTASEYQVKAAFLYNFARFVEWPSGMFGSDTSVFVVGIAGDSPFSNEMAAVLRGKTLGNRRIVVRRVSGTDELRGCHLLFIPSSASGDLPRLLSSVGGRSILTVGDDEDFARRGTIISFMLVDGKVRFAVNVNAAAQAQLRISSKLLNLAHITAGETATQ